MKVVKLGEVARWGSGGTPPRQVLDYFGGEYPWVAIADLNDGPISTTAEHLTKAGIENSSAKLVPAQTVLIAMYGSIGKLGITTREMCTSQAIAFAVPNEDFIDTRYFFHFLLASRAKLQHLGRGGTQKNIGQANLKNFEIPLPSLEEQRRIAAILDQADALRTQRRAQLAALDALPQAIFHEMVSSTPVNRVPLGELFKFNSGRFLPAKSQQPGPYPVYGGNGINGLHAEKMFSGRQIVIGRVGAYCGAVHLTTGAAWVTDNAIIASPLNHEIALEFLTESLRAAKLNQYKSQSGQPLISGSRLKEITIPIPDEKFQNEFSYITRKVAIVAERAKAGENSLDTLFASLQSRAFRGEL